MTWWMCTNLKKVNEWKLKQRTILVMGIFADLENWATPHKSNDVTDNNIYYLLYREKIHVELPFLGSISTISRSIKELEDKGIIKSINKNTTPAYCLTEKGLTWKRRANISSNDGDSKPKNTTPKQSHKSPIKMALGKKVAIGDLGKEYVALLYTSCMKMGLEKGIINPREEFDKFIEHHSKMGNKFANWLAAFSTWCRKRKELDKKDTNIRNEGRGLYK